VALDKKTTILFPERLHQLLSRLAKQKRVSLGFLVREACLSVYGIDSQQSRVGAVQGLAELSLPVSDVCTMKRESVADSNVPSNTD